MAPRSLCMALLATMLWTGASAQSNDCTSALVSLSPCLNFITGTDTTPTVPCCQQLATMVQSEPKCLCLIINGGSSFMAITINQTLALALPTACNVQTPPATRCNTSSGPTVAPTPSPSTPSSGGGGSGTSDGSVKQLPLALIFSLVFVAVYLSSPPINI